MWNKVLKLREMLYSYFFMDEHELGIRVLKEESSIFYIIPSISQYVPIRAAKSICRIGMKHCI